jgi:hypothetical protein
MVLNGLLVLVLFAASTGASQDQTGLQSPFKLTADSLNLTAGPEAWTIRITRFGGIAGTFTEVTIGSEGKLECVFSTQAKCRALLPSTELLSLKQLALAPTISSGESSLNSTCMDCFKYRVTLRRREVGGRDRVYFAYWDDSTASKVSPELTRLLEATLNAAR